MSSKSVQISITSTDKENSKIGANESLSTPDSWYKVKAGLFLTSVAGIGFFAGFGSSLAAIKKKDPVSFDEGLVGKNSEAAVYESGARLASRALARGTLYAFIGCGVLFYSAWKLSGARDLEHFRQKAGNILPKIPKNNPPVGRTEFSGLNDFLNYVIERDKEEKELKKRSESTKCQ